MKLLLAAVVLVVSAMCLEGLLGTNLSLNADRRGDTDTFDVSASFTAVDADGNAMAGASVYCADASDRFSSKGTANSEGTLSVSESFTLSSSDCPRKEVTKSCYAEKGSTKTETVSDTVELECRSATSNATATPKSTSTPTPACDLGCKAAGAAGGACAPAGVIGPRCCGDVESAYKSQVACSANQTVSWMSSSVSGSYKCEDGNGCFCYKLDNCDAGCKSGKCIVPTACQAKGATGKAACGTIGKSCDSTTCSGGCDAVSTVDDPCGCLATCK